MSDIHEQDTCRDGGCPLAHGPWIQCTTVTNDCLGGCTSHKEHITYERYLSIMRKAGGPPVDPAPDGAMSGHLTLKFNDGVAALVYSGAGSAALKSLGLHTSDEFEALLAILKKLVPDDPSYPRCTDKCLRQHFDFDEQPECACGADRMRYEFAEARTAIAKAEGTP